MIGVGVVGYGYWGPNLVRNFWSVPGARLVSVCDRRAERLALVTSQFPAVEVTADYDHLLKDSRVDVVAVATPVSSHFDLALRALQAAASETLREATERFPLNGLAR